jgi:hypothetical protein
MPTGRPETGLVERSPELQPYGGEQPARCRLGLLTAWSMGYMKSCYSKQLSNQYERVWAEHIPNLGGGGGNSRAFIF